MWFDVETTGLNPIINDIIELACIMTYDGEIVDKICWKMQPSNYDTISDEAMKIHGYTMEDLETFKNPKECFSEFMLFITKHVSPYNKKDKMYFGGYNVQFDIGFLKNWFQLNEQGYFGAYFNYRSVDPMILINILEANNKLDFDLENHKLLTLANHFKIPINAHQALSDVEATLKLNDLLIKRYME